METRAPGSSSLLGSLRGLADGLLHSAHDRLELLTVELHEEKYRLIQIFIWISAIVFLAMLAMVFLSLALVVVFWETHRVLVVCTLASVYVAALVGMALSFKAYLKRQPKPFSGTLEELRQDRACIPPKN